MTPLMQSLILNCWLKPESGTKRLTLLNYQRAVLHMLDQAAQAANMSTSMSIQHIDNQQKL